MNPTKKLAAAQSAARLLLAAALAMSALSGFAQTAEDDGLCGSLQNGYGPYDYRTRRGPTLDVVEIAHFTPKVENLIGGNTTTEPAPDIAYTLHAFPNHHRALIAMERLGDRTKTDQPRGARYTVECYFQRAIRFKPDDTIARTLYAQYLGQKGRSAEAIKQLDVAADYAKDNPFSHFNIGLMFFDLKQYDKALAQAHIALGMGFDRPELRERLQSVGKWTDPAPAGNAAAQAPAADSNKAADAAAPAAVPASATPAQK